MNTGDRTAERDCAQAGERCGCCRSFLTCTIRFAKIEVGTSRTCDGFTVFLRERIARESDGFIFAGIKGQTGVVAHIDCTALEGRVAREGTIALNGHRSGFSIDCAAFTNFSRCFVVGERDTIKIDFVIMPIEI